MKGEEFFEPPGLHQRADRSINELLEELKSLNYLCERQGREFIANRLKEGELLIRLKKRIGHNHWQKWCEEHLPYDVRTARRRIAATERSRQLQNGHVSVLDDDLKAQVQDEEEVVETPSSDATIPESAAGMAPAPTKPPILCSACQRKGWMPGCNVCEFLNRPAKGERRPPPVPEIIEEVAPEPGSYAWKPFSWAQVNASLGCIFEQLHALAQEHDRIDDPRYAEIKDTAVAFSAAISAFHKTIKEKK